MRRIFSSLLTLLGIFCFLAITNAQFNSRLYCPRINFKRQNNVEILCTSPNGEENDCSTEMPSGTEVSYKCVEYFIPKSGIRYQQFQILCNSNGQWDKLEELIRFVCVPDCGKLRDTHKIPPWEMSIGKNGTKARCIGSLIPSLISESPSVILTYKYCVSYSNGTLLPSSELIVTLPSRRLDLAQQFQVDSIHLPNNPTGNIAILRLTSFLTLSDIIHPVCLPFDIYSPTSSDNGSNKNQVRYLLTPGTTGIVIENGFPTDLNVTSAQSCVSQFNYKPEESEFCTVKEVNEATCSSVNGPFLVSKPSTFSEKTYILHGTFNGSLKVEDCQGGVTYSRISLFKTWIQNTLKNISGIQNDLYNSSRTFVSTTRNPSGNITKQSSLNNACPPLETDLMDGFLIQCNFNDERMDCLKDSVPIGTTATYKCQEFFTRPEVGSTTSRKCKSNRQWSNIRRDFRCTLTCGEAQNQLQLQHQINQGNKWPWVGTIYQIKTRSDATLLCDGIIISQNAILTTAQCVSTSSSSKTNTLLNKENLRILFNKKVPNYDEGTVHSRLVRDIHVHPNYTSQSMKSNLAVIFLNKPIEVTSVVRPVCLPPETVNDSEIHPSVGDSGVILRWRNQTNSSGAGGFKEIKVSVLLPKACKTLSPRIDSSANFCVGRELQERDSCEGPRELNGIFYESKFGRSYRWSLIGLASSVDQGIGINCEYRMNSIFTRIAFHRAWIDTILDRYERTNRNINK